MSVRSSLEICQCRRATGFPSAVADRLRENRHTLETEEQHQRSEQRNQREWLQCTKPSRQIVPDSCRDQLSPI